MLLYCGRDIKITNIPDGSGLHSQTDDTLEVASLSDSHSTETEQKVNKREIMTLIDSNMCLQCMGALTVTHKPNTFV